MTRPQIIRADSIDLQDPETTSAKDHSRGHPNGSATLAPHQAATLREVAQETAEENTRSPRVSWTGGDGAGDLQKYAEDLVNGITIKLHDDPSSDDDDDKNMDSAAKKQHQQDSLAVAQNGGLSGHSDDGDIDGDTDESLEDDMMDKISSSPSIEDEDIDFEFVYALHTFVATVEGQANATKGDTMVLLDDSNSYWWLVRVVKDSSIGYLPAEHIETPTERLARLNKHRNIDLSATMLGDQPGEKSKSTFRSALRGKKRKTVAFAEPTYVDYSDFDYSSDEEDVEELFGTKQQNGTKQDQQQQDQQKEKENNANEQSASSDDAMLDETAKVEPLKPRPQADDKSAESPKKEATDEDDDSRASSEQLLETKTEGPSRSRNGTVRNTDSFFKDETVETKKITLTPNLLRDDNQPRPSSESKELRQRPSLDKMDKMEKELQPDKKEDKKKDKKPSAIRSFFSRKDKKKATGEDDESLGKRSMDTVNENDQEDDQPESSPEKATAPQRNPSKLQKQQPRAEPSPTRKPGSAPQRSTTREIADYIAMEGRTNDVSNVPPASMRIVQEQDAAQSPNSADQQSWDRPADQARSGSQQKEDRSGLSKIKLSRTASNDKPSKVEKPQKVTKAKARVELDDFDSPDEDITPTESQPAQETRLRPTLPGAYPDSYMSGQSDKTPSEAAQPQATHERLSESPVHVSPVTSNNPPALVRDTSSQEGQSSNSPSPELVDVEDASRHRHQDSVTTTSTPTVGSQSSGTWNDAKLRAFFDSSSDIRDMLVVVYDKSDVVPAGPDHPLVGTLFREQNAKLAEITTQLDNMLGDWLARKQRLRGTL